jgi:hypothetical protein
MHCIRRTYLLMWLRKALSNAAAVLVLKQSASAVLSLKAACWKSKVLILLWLTQFYVYLQTRSFPPLFKTPCSQYFLSQVEGGNSFSHHSGRKTSAAVCSAAAAAPKLSTTRAALLILYIVKLSISKVYRQLCNL